jgi:hypothetical protein
VITLSTPDKDNSQIEVVGHEAGGLVVANAAGMIEAMHQLEDPALRRQFADQGSSEIVKRYSVEQLIPAAIDIAQLVSEGLSRSELQRRLLGRPQICTHVSRDEINELMQACIGRYRLRTRVLLNLVSNPFLYRSYRLATGRPA